jgi:competence ComEA-like helix-hairpin-helix protein
MQGPPFTGTRWFSLSGRELLTLLVGVALVAVGVTLARGIEWAWGSGEVSVVESPAVLPAAPRLDLNTATAPELELLPGIGPKTAAAIVARRRENGPFADWQEVLEVPGIGPHTVEQIRPYAMCKPPSSHGDAP